MNKKGNNRNVAKAFTLVELLVVISIIAMLLSILIPTLSKVRAQAKLLICKTNLKTWGTAAMTYASDWSGRFPLAGSRNSAGVLSNPEWGSNYPSAPFWDAILLRYISSEFKAYPATAYKDSKYITKKEDKLYGFQSKSFDFLYCPGMVDIPKYRQYYDLIKRGLALDNTSTPASNHFPRTYKINALITGHGDLNGEISSAYFSSKAYQNGMAMADVRNPSNTFLVVESDLTAKQVYNVIYGWAARDWFDVRPGHFVKFGATFTDTWGTNPRQIGKSNNCFADGHVETLTRDYKPDTWPDGTKRVLDNAAKTYWKDGDPENARVYKFQAGKNSLHESR